jgi:hypothetical protein
LPFKFNLRRYNAAAGRRVFVVLDKGVNQATLEVGLCTLKQVDP